ncbi:VOC family protein [Desulfonatronum thiosulfatophilum]|nr:VOC family protein [Desulfonatronum thiosulfatophilum]
MMNKVVHFELPSEDRERAKKFYALVFGWNMEDMPHKDDVYTFAITTPVDDHYMHTEKGAINGGIFKKESALQHPVVTIEVPSIDDHVKLIEQAGGQLVVPKGEVPDMGYYAYFRDTEGNVMGLWENKAKG